MGGLSRSFSAEKGATTKARPATFSSLPLGWGCQRKRFAEHFKRDPVVISKGVRGVWKRLAEDRLFARSLEMMEKTLIENKQCQIVY